MVDIQSKEVIDKISDELKIQPAVDIPRNLAKDIQLVFDVSQKQFGIFIKTATASDATSALIHTCKLGVRTFFIGYYLSVAKSVASTSLFSQVRVTTVHEPVVNAVVTMRYEPVTAGDLIINTSFPIPMELAAGSEITVTNSTNVASIDTVAGVYLYEVNPQ